MKKQKYNYFAKTAHGLEEILAAELQSLGATDIKTAKRGVAFKGEQSVLYKANYRCRTAIRILKPLFTFNARNERQFYHKIYDFDWSQIFGVNNNFLVSCTLHSTYFNHSHFLALKCKDAIVDQFRQKFDRRPNVNTLNPQFRIDVRVTNDACTVSLDSSGEPLFKRGYREMSVEAPMNEILAAGIVQLSGWDQKQPLLDFMCGSGTILIEAAMLATNTPAQTLRDDFAFRRWQDYDASLYHQVKNEAKAEVKEPKCEIYGADLSLKAIKATQQNAYMLNLDRYMSLERKNYKRIEKPHEEGTIIINPPYDERLELEESSEFYKKIGDKLKQDFSNWNAWIITSNFEALNKIGLKASKKHTLYNGQLECRFNKYELYRGKREEVG